MAESYDTSSHPGFAAAHLTLKGLHRQANQFKAELLRLQQSLDLLNAEFSGNQQHHLIAANEQLVLSSIQAEQALAQVKTRVGEITRTSQRDALTDTANRTLMSDRITRSISYARRHQRQLALIFLDLDHFKQINDHLGHQTGDDVLKLVAHRLKSVLRDSDTISRHGGDEFLILMSAIDNHQAADVIARKILEALAAPVMCIDQPLLIRASLGIAFYPAHGLDAPALIQSADNAMYHSKRRGGSCYSICNVNTQGIASGLVADVSRSDTASSFRVSAIAHRHPGRQPTY